MQLARREVFRVPLHCCTGMIIGMGLAYRKFLGKGGTCARACVFTLAVPILIHGTYDFVQGLSDLEALEGHGQQCFIMSLLILIGGFVYTRCLWLSLENICVCHVKDLVRDGRVSKSHFCCCEPDCCKCSSTPEDPVLEAERQS